MALYRTDAIVLGYRNLGESDKILTLFSPDKGKMHAVARGVRRPRNPILAGSQLFSYSNFLILKGRNLDSISQCEIKESFFKIRQNLERMAFGLYFAELLRASTPIEDKNKELFYFFLKTLYFLQEWDDLDILCRIYELKLLAIQGFLPEIYRCIGCGRDEFDEIYFSVSMGGILCNSCHEKDTNAIKIDPQTLAALRHILLCTYERLKELRLNKVVKERIKDILKKFISHHIDRKLKTVDFLNDIRNLKNQKGQGSGFSG